MTLIKKESILRDRNLYLIFSITLISTLGVSTVSPAFPEIMAALKISEAQVGMLITVFSLPGVILAPFIGVLGDRWGRKKVIVPSLFLFGISGFSCMFTNNFDLILFLRIFQGIGASGLVTLASTIVGDLYTGNRVPEAIGYNSSVVSFSLMVYPTIGGALAMVDWHFPFILPIAAIPVGIMVISLLHNPEPVKSSSFGDYLLGSWHCLKDVQLIGLFLAGIMGFVILFGAVQTYYPLLLSSSFNASAFVIGLIFSAGSLAMAVSASQMGKLHRKYSVKTLLIVAFSIHAAACVLVLNITITVFLVIPVFAFNLANGIIVPTVVSAVSRKASLEYRAMVMSVISTMLRLGQTIGPPIMGLLFVIGAFDAVYYGSALMALLMILIVTICCKLGKQPYLSNEVGNNITAAVPKAMTPEKPTGNESR